ncbi:GNAT family N-acetyltransferase [Clostridium sp. UBA6640]|uniref:GNAT family N-acetyltransferase n=1 Tax=Clostridium sp. UBA6640 TaxID=1946370 RepID=UPI0025BCB7A0|nr:GNAT family N-acetyltransferase [Clostridium sp. UBA6640]
MIYYESNEFNIRDIRQDDVIRLFYWSVDKELNKHDPKPIPRNAKELMAECNDYCTRFDKEVMSDNVENIKYKYFIITNNEDTPIGFVNFFSIDKIKKQGEMGVKLGDIRYWSKGIAYSAVSTIINYIFKNMDIDRIHIETGESNTAALKLFNKLNFNKCGEYLEDEDFKFIVMEKFKR